MNYYFYTKKMISLIYIFLIPFKKIFIKKLMLQDETFFNIRYKYPKYETIDYLVINGIVFMELTLNHVEIFDKLNLNFSDSNNLLQSKLIISSILNTNIINEEIISSGLIIKTINEKNINTIQELTQFVKKYKEINLKFTNNIIYTIQINKNV